MCKGGSICLPYKWRRFGVWGVYVEGVCVVYGQWFVWKLCAVYVLSVVILCEGDKCGCVGHV